MEINNEYYFIVNTILNNTYLQQGNPVSQLLIPVMIYFAPKPLSSLFIWFRSICLCGTAIFVCRRQVIKIPLTDKPR